MTKEIKHQICGDGFIQYHPTKTPPPRNTWVGLTDEDMVESARWADEHGGGPFYVAYAQALEQILKERNT